MTLTISSSRIRNVIALAIALVVLGVSIASPASARPRRRARSGCAAITACQGLTQPGRDAFQRLMAASVFAVEGSAADEVIPEDVIALRVLIGDPAARPAIEHLFRNATPVGRLYAVVAFWHVAPRLYHARREALMHTNGQDQVTTQLGGSVQTRTIAAVLAPNTGVPRYRPGTGQLDAFCPPLLHNDPSAMGSNFAGGGSAIAMLYGPRVTREACDAWAAAQQPVSASASTP